MRDFIQIEIVSDDLAFVNLGQLDQLQIHLAHRREVVLHNLNIQRRHFLQLLQDVQATPSPIALHRVGRIRHHLQFAQHELRYDDYTIQKSGFRNI